MSDPFIVSDGAHSRSGWLTSTLCSTRSTRDRPHLIGFGAGGPLSVLYAAAKSERVASLVLINAWTRLRRANDYPFGIDPATEEDLIELMVASWGVSDGLATSAPSLSGDVGFRNWHRRHLRLSSSPSTIASMQRMLFRTDVRGALPSVRCPTLVVHRRGNVMVPVEHGRYIAGTSPPRARRTGRHRSPLLGRRSRRGPRRDRALPDRSAHDRNGRPCPRHDALHRSRGVHRRDGQARRRRLGVHARTSRSDRRSTGGTVPWTLVNTTGDGMLAMFDSPSGAARLRMRHPSGGVGARVTAASWDPYRRGATSWRRRDGDRRRDSCTGGSVRRRPADPRGHPPFET